jgi:phage tail sheath gpL-like
MAVYWISYRLNADPGRTERQYALIKAIHAYKKRYWDRTESFVIFETMHTIEFLTEVFKDQINLRTDLFLLRDLDAPSAVLCGANTDPDIMTLMPYCRHITS